ncbi:hypothetical protein CYLTODRAFT_427024 [Cylindrobasidium torrendii FP15055 ss-10]|uniref:MYND-type domain-containing protein n=1 Tax=Cylindrobasidium torrendii FP15055 ss-10 TaxID=1314674 RepID=A0A0D7AVA9_9AGAR|nr:hypothetical protein CYLTODRAFT_427024 [Cylindrobasidium torrendii FP15055 ss-10]
MPNIPHFTVWCPVAPVAPDIHYNTLSEAKDDALSMSNSDARRLAALRYVTNRIMKCPPRSGVFDTITLPLVSFYLHPSKCPSFADIPSIWEDRLDFVWSCLLLLRESAKGGNTNKMIAEDALRKWWPGLSKWMVYLFRRAIEDGNILEGKWRDVLIAALSFASLSLVNSDSRIADATWHRHPDVAFAFVQLGHSLTAYVLAKYSSDPPEDGYDSIAMVVSNTIAHRVILSTAATSEIPGRTPTLPKLLTSPSLGGSAISSLITAISIRPLPLRMLDQVLTSVNDAAGTLGNRFHLAAQRAVYWNVMALHSIVKHKLNGQMAPQTHELMTSCAESALMYIYFALGYMSRDIMPDLAHLRIFHIIVGLAPLVDCPPGILSTIDLKATIRGLLSRLALFGGWKCIARAVGPHIEALRVYELDGDLVDGSSKPKRSFINIFSELHEASMTYGDRSQRVCWNPNCPAITPESYGQEDGPLCRACSRCWAVAYCSNECQRVDWNLGHKEDCQSICDDEQLYRNEHRPGRESTLMKQPPPILLKQKTFMYHYVEHLLSKNLNSIYTYFVDPTTGAYIDVDGDDAICVMYFMNPPVYFKNGSLWGYELSEAQRLVQFGVPWNMTDSAFDRKVGPPDAQIFFGTVELPAEGDVFKKGSALELKSTFSQYYEGCPLGGWRIAGGV